MAISLIEDLIPSYSKINELLDEFKEVETKLSDPEVISNNDLNRKFSRRFSELNKTVPLINETIEMANDLITAEELIDEDPSFAKEIDNDRNKLQELNDKLAIELMPKDEDDPKDIIMEIKGGAGGEESKLFAGDLLRMYQRYCDNKGYKVKILEASETGIGGYNNVELSISNPCNDPEGVWHFMKYEGGVHRVQRVPVTESSGRIHTSAVGVLVFPEVETDDEIDIPATDLKVDVFRSSGPGGQSVNTTDSAVRITHIPTGTVVSMQNEKSQIQNRAAGMKVLKSRLLALKREEEEAAAGDLRKSQVRTLDRSERVRTYNFPENRITDHRSNFKAYNLNEVMEGNLDPVINSLLELDLNEAVTN